MPSSHYPVNLVTPLLPPFVGAFQVGHEFTAADGATSPSSATWKEMFTQKTEGLPYYCNWCRNFEEKLGGFVGI